MQKTIGTVNAHETNLKRKGPSKTAELMAFNRVVESAKPEGERICYDPYAIRFIGPEYLKFLKVLASDPDKAKASREQMERLYPGVHNSIVARVRYFDDSVRTSIKEGLEQLVILGAGYDTRAYRIKGLKDTVRVFEVDHPDTQKMKMEKIKEIFGSLPDYIAYIPVDLTTEDFGQGLIEQGYDRSQKTLFIMEGLVMYLTPIAVDEMLSFIARNSGKGSAVLFDYFPESLVDGTYELKAGKNMRKYAEEQGEPFQFGIKEGTVETFLAKRGFSQIQNVTSEDCRRAYFHGKNENSEVCSLSSFVHAVVE